jgi:putative ABC transport system permease protein
MAGAERNGSEGGGRVAGGGGRPPALALALLTVLLRNPAREVIAGDLAEAFARWANRDGMVQARRWYWRGALASIAARWIRGLRSALPLSGGVPSGGGGLPVGMTEVRHAWRGLTRRPGFTVLAVVTLGLGIGATTTVYAMLNEVLFRPLAGVHEPAGVAYIQFPPLTGGFNGASLSPPNFEDLRAGATLFEDVAGYGLTSLVASVEDRAPVSAAGQIFQGAYFEALGVRAAVGRVFRADETGANADPSLVVISERLWATLFDRAPDVAGRPVRLNRRTYTVIGVAGGGFAGVQRGITIDAWITPTTLFQMFNSTASMTDRSQWLFNDLIGRTKPGVSDAAAEQQLKEMYARLITAYPKENEGLAGHTPRMYPGLGVTPMMREWTTSVVRLLFGAVGMVLLIACANVSNLLLLRSTERRSEVAMRRALGATGVRVFAQQMMESLLLALMAGATAVVVAFGLAQLFRGTRMIRLPPFEGLSPDPLILGFAIAVAAVSAVLAGTVPAVLTGRVESSRALREAGGRDTGRRAVLRSAMTVLQLALSLTLLVGSLLLVRTVRNLYAVDLGFEPAGLLTFGVDFDRRASPEQIDARKRQLYERLRSVPGVQGVAFDMYGPLWGSSFNSHVVRPGGDIENATRVSHRFATPAYFETLGIRVVRGRGFRDSDWDASQRQNVVITSALAQLLFGPADPVGQELLVPSRRAPEALRVIGVTGDLRLLSPIGEPDLAIFQTTAASPLPFVTVLVRAPGAGPQVIEALREAASSVMPDTPIAEAVALTAKRDDRISEPRLFARLLTVVSALAVLLAAIGLYGVIAWTVAERTREIGVRMALGARAGGISRLVLSQTGRLVGIGIGLGLLAAAWSTRLIESRLFGVTAVDLLTYASAALFFVAVALAACLAPARTATRVDPMRALRQE